MRSIHLIPAGVLCALLLAGCQSNGSRPDAQDHAVSGKNSSSRVSGVFWPQRAKTLADSESPSDLWQLTRQHMLLDAEQRNTRIDEQLAWFRKHTGYMREASEQSVPYYHYVLNQVLERELPAELALLPFVESSYDPFAVSPSDAAGPWQFIPGTASLFGLRSNWWYDGRRDIIESTQAALDYLEYLNGRFEGDWLLALAAYNGGEGTVSRAVKHNLQNGEPTDYWNLSLPLETQRYVPKLLAIARLISAPDSYGLELPKIGSEPYFVVVPTPGQIELDKAARLAGVDSEELTRLNPGFSRWATDPAGPHRLLVPAARAERFQKALAKLPAEARINYARYTIRSGDTLSSIASRFDTKVSTIKQANKMRGNAIRTGQTLMIPSPADARDIQLASNTPAASSKATASHRVHKVSNGENLWQIARQYGVSTGELARWNRISDATVLRPGQDLVLYPGSRDPG